MAHFAELDTDNIVIQVIVINNEDILDSNGNESEDIGISFCQDLFGSDSNWKQTSYNNTFRKNYAGIGYTYDETRDAFIAPKPYPSFVLNEDTCQWEAPVSYPVTLPGEVYTWDEETIQWIRVDETQA